MQRLQDLSRQLDQSNTHSTPPQQKKLPDDVVICRAVRTALTKSKKGGFKDTPCEAMLAPLFRNILEQTKIDPSKIEDVVVGNVLQSGAGVLQVRMAALLGGIPDTSCAIAINRMCSSGLEAVSMVANKIQAGVIEVGIAGGVENMSMYDMQSSVDPEKVSEAVFEHEQARNCLMGMGETSENVAQKFGITRLQQDTMAVESHRRSSLAQEQGLFKDEIVPVQATVKDQDGKEKSVLVSQDEGMRKDTTLEGLSKLKPAFRKGGTTTAGNSSQVTDGAALILLARRSTAEKLGLPILARYVAYAVAGVPPEIMGIGPAFAIPKVLQKAGLTKECVSIYEINEAFASQATYTCDQLKLNMAKVNPKGGAISLGHPLGCTGARQICTLLPELKRTKGRFGCIAMCIGTGMGAAAVIENEQL